jgi:putative membrane protein
MPHLRKMLWAVGIIAPAVAGAHAAESPEGDSSLLVGGLLMLAALMYVAGLLRLWPQTHARTQLRWRAVSFATGWVALLTALLSPLDQWASSSFAWHMVQHEVLMLVAAPLLVIGRGLPTFLWALPHDARLALGRATKQNWLRASWNGLMSPLSAWTLHAAALWLWHVPAFFNAAVTQSGIHDWQHASFLGTALIFWHALLRKSVRASRGLALVYLFTTTIHTGVLGAFLTFAPRVLYATFDAGLRDRATTALEDQQLGGLIMWVPGSIVYVTVALLLAAQWLRSLEPASGSSSSPPPMTPRF